MICVEVSITPVGTGSTSVSEYVVESEKALKKHTNLTYKLTGMGTEIQGNSLDEIFAAIKDMHEAQIKKGAQRISAIIRIDDRRDKEGSLEEKVQSVKTKM